MRRFALPRITAQTSGEEMIVRLNKKTEEFQNYNENWITAEEEEEDVEEQIRKEKIFINPCTRYMMCMLLFCSSSLLTSLWCTLQSFSCTPCFCVETSHYFNTLGKKFMPFARLTTVDSLLYRRLPI